MNPDDESWAIKLLAVAVIRRAFQDLCFTSVVNSSLCRDDAYDFLLNRIWSDDCLWFEILGRGLTRRLVISRAKRLYSMKGSQRA